MSNDRNFLRDNLKSENSQNIKLLCKKTRKSNFETPEVSKEVEPGRKILKMLKEA